MTWLWTDIMIWILVGMLLMLGIFIVRRPYLRTPWRKVFYKPIHLAATLILGVFVIIGLLDSLHFKVSDHNGLQPVVSILDVLIKPAMEHTESSYSKPFATHAFVKENALQPDGEIIRDYPRLKYGGSHLESLDKQSKDIWNRFLMASAQSIIISSLCALILLFLVSFKTKTSFETLIGQIIYGDRAFPWKTLILTLAIVVWLIFLVQAYMPVYHIFGTSKVGEDVFYQTMKSVRTGLVIGTLTTLFMLPLAVVLGIMAGFFRGIVDDVIQYIYTTLSSIPGVLLIAAAVLSLQVIMSHHEAWFPTTLERSDARLLALCAILGITSWTGLCRLLRGEALKLRDIEFVQAARALGVKKVKIIFKHLLPNVIHIILISIALDFSGLVLAEAVLSYVGVGVDPASYSWGTMINSARLEMARVPVVWWSLSAAFIMMFTMVLAANIFADAVRDAFDPRV